MTDDEKAKACADAFKPLVTPKPPPPWRETSVVNVQVRIDLDQASNRETEMVLKAVKELLKSDGLQVYVHRERLTLCRYCKMTPDEDVNGYPWCCGRAQDEARALGIIEEA